MLCNLLSCLKLVMFICVLVEAIGEHDLTILVSRGLLRSHLHPRSTEAARLELGRRSLGRLFGVPGLSLNGIEKYQSGMPLNIVLWLLLIQ